MHHKKLLFVLLGVLAVLLVFCAVELFYFPKYLTARPRLLAPEKETKSDITVVSANVRCFSPTDLFKKSWFYRAPLLVQTLADCQPDIIGFQEVTRLHLGYLRDTLQGYDFVICYRDDSLFSEGCPVFYNTQRFELVEKGSFWLSETPEVSSRDWDAAFPRVCSYVILQQYADGQRLVVFNTHLDHVSDTARINGMQVILDKIEQFGNLPCILMGDLNADEESSTYAAATEHFFDAKYQTQTTDRGATYQNWGKSLDRENIDYFMISKTGIQVREYRVIRTTYNGVYPSDHFPVLLKMEMG